MQLAKHSSNQFLECGKITRGERSQPMPNQSLLKNGKDWLEYGWPHTRST
jgi:hypothetical protein